MNISHLREDSTVRTLRLRFSLNTGFFPPPFMILVDTANSGSLVKQSLA
ncbi:hypothetical protein SLEP1_g51071 [Rubroshorea leprosula]|uniref:Uncharacterized protein n=1 Tax=Rubroshorea leprosula TaxID=152421 RepID=A0AAV5M1Z9_9ROSI|nr:hypothetical protein SLEP1_g51071 [Rubroshorea leprosula]